MKLTKLCSELSPRQQTRLVEIIRLVIESMNQRDLNNTSCAFTNIPATEKEMQTLCLRSKTSIMKNIPLQKVAYDKDLAAIMSSDPVKNSSMLGLDVATIRSTIAKEDASKYENNNIVDGVGIQKEINELAKK